MINRPNYYKATNAAYEVLSDFGDVCLPIDIFHIVHTFPNICLIKYSDNAKQYNVSFNNYLKAASSDFGFIMKLGKINCILYNDNKNYESCRFTIAHELGHILLNHKEDNDITRKEASCFARNLLCPIPVIDELNIDDYKNYIDTFGISEIMANISYVYKSSDKYYIKRYLYTNIVDLFFKYMTGNTHEKLYGYS